MQAGVTNRTQTSSVFSTASLRTRRFAFSKRLKQQPRSKKNGLNTYKGFVHQANPRFQFFEHNECLADVCERIASRELKRVMIFLPPRHSKSEMFSRLFSAYYLKKYPHHWVGLNSYAAELAHTLSNSARSNFVACGGELSPDTTAKKHWETMQGGGMWAAGVGGPITGKGFHLGIIDDPFGSKEDAYSERIRERVWEWYINDFSARLKPDAKRVIMHTRWHLDDLAGRIIEQAAGIGQKIKIVSLPAIAGANDPLGRRPGEYLWDEPDGYNYAKFLRRRKAETAALEWAALYQQEPTPDEGDYFRREWIVPVERLPKASDLRVYGGSDYAVTSHGGDYTVHAVIGLDADENLYLLDIWRKQASSDVWVDAWCDLVKRHRPIEWAEEQGQIKSGVGPFLDKVARERGAYCVRTQFPTRGDKAVRAQSIRGRMAMRGLRIPAFAPWKNEFEAELLRFPAGLHDDQVDAIGLVGQLLDKTVGAARRAKEPKDTMSDYRSVDRTDRDEASGLTL